MGGKIQVESEVNKGSHFYFTIPIHPEEAGEAPAKGDFAVSDPDKALPAQPEKLKKQLAEDDKVSIIYLKAILENIDCEIIEAENGEQVLDLCKKYPDIELILMDIQMPLMDGYEATRKIREFNKDVHIIAQTAFALGGDREKALQAGCNEYIPKPIDREQLLHLLEQYISEKIRAIQTYKRGPAATSALPSSLSVNCSKLSINSSASFFAFLSHSAASA